MLMDIPYNALRTRFSTNNNKTNAQSFYCYKTDVGWMTDNYLSVDHVQLIKDDTQRCSTYISHPYDSCGESTELFYHLVATALMCFYQATPDEIQSRFCDAEHLVHLNVLCTGYYLPKKISARLNKPVPINFTANNGHSYTFYAMVDICNNLSKNGLSTAMKWAENAIKNYKITHGMQHPHLQELNLFLRKMQNYEINDEHLLPTVKAEELQQIIDYLETENTSIDSLVFSKTQCNSTCSCGYSS